MGRSILFLVIAASALLIGAGEGTAVATLIQKDGTVEVWRGDRWQELLPLQPLYDGDQVRVSQGTAVLSDLGFSSQTLTAAGSPFTVKGKKVDQGKSKKALAKLNKIFTGLVHGPQEKNVTLATRGSGSAMQGALRLCGPDRTPIVIPTGPVTFRWEGASPPYIFKIFKAGFGESKPVIRESKSEENSAVIPADYFEEQTIYEWEVMAGALKGSAKFQVLGKEESDSLRSELAEILAEVPGNDELTRVLVTYGFFSESGLGGDARRIRDEALRKFPDNAALQRLGQEH